MTQSSQDGTAGAPATGPASEPASDPVSSDNISADDGGKSVVSRNFSIVGDLTCHDVLKIDGSVEGNIVCQELTVSKAGRITGDIRADTVEMHGTLTGAIDARVLTLSKTSSVVGDIVVHETLGIEPGANFDGNCKKLGGADGKADDAVGDSAAVGEEAAASQDAADEPDIASNPEADAGDAPAANMSNALDRVAAELKASIHNGPSEKAESEPQSEPAMTEPAETVAAAAALPAETAAPDAEAKPAPAKDTAPLASRPAKPAAEGNGAALAG